MIHSERTDVRRAAFSELGLVTSIDDARRTVTLTRCDVDRPIR